MKNNENYWKLKPRDFLPFYGIIIYSDRVTRRLIRMRMERKSHIESIINKNTFPRATLLALVNTGYIFAGIMLAKNLTP